MTGESRAPRRTGRRAGDSGTREAILAAARQRFASHGYTGTTIRGIAGDAGVGPALVHHFYGTKERLFAAAMRLPVVPSEVIGAALGSDASRPADNLGERLVRTVLGVWDATEVRATLLALLRSAVTNEQAMVMLREFVTAAILGSIAGAIGPPGEQVTVDDASYRASLVASQILGLAMTRYVFQLEPIATASADDLAIALGPTVQRYLTGDVHG